MLSAQGNDVHLVRGSLVLAASIAITGLGGFAFWWFAAWHLDAADVGAGQGLFVAVTVVGCLTSMGLPIAVARFCGDLSVDAIELWRWSVVYALAMSWIGAIVLWVLAPASILEPFDGAGAIITVGVLGFIVGGMSLAVLVEVRLLALRQWRWVLARVVSVAILRLALLWVLPEATGLDLVLLGAGIPAASGWVGASVLWRWTPARAGWWRTPTGLLRPWMRFSTVNYLSLVGIQGPMFLIPFVLAVQLDAAPFAPFYLAWAMAQILFAVPHMLGQVFLTEAGKPGADPNRQLRIMLQFGIFGMTAAAAISLLAGRVIAWSLGDDYASVGELLPWLITGCIPWAVTAALLAWARLVNESRRVLAMTATFALTSVAAVSVLAVNRGALAASKGWLLANLLTAGVALITSWATLSTAPLGPRLAAGSLKLEVQVDG